MLAIDRKIGIENQYGVPVMDFSHPHDIRAHQGNMQRYYRLLATELTVTERQFIHNRIAEERAELERLVAVVDLGAGNQPLLWPTSQYRPPCVETG